MKISLRWLCDHLVATSWTDIDSEQLVADFNTKVAEIEHQFRVAVPVDSFAAGRIIARKDDQCQVEVAQWNETVTLKNRTDLSEKIHEQAAFLIKRTDTGVAWVSLKEMGLEKDGLLPALHIADADLAGVWRDAWETDDIIFDVDNKSITHRPDMWGHRGFAREVAALLDVAMRDESEFLADLPLHYVSERTTNTSEHTCQLAIQAPQTCSTISGMTVPQVKHMPCDVRTVSRFVKVDYRPINAIVDLTNYVMGDWGRPMHAYDADRVAGHTLTVRMAQPGEQLMLLDESVLELTADDMVIADTEKILGLAGVMGGKDDSINDNTKDILLEAACFHAATIRRSAARFKLRTESSQRFEKTLDPGTAPEALQRFTALAVAWGVLESIPVTGISIVGEPAQDSIITLSHSYLTDRLGCDINTAQVKELLTPLDFEVDIEGAGDEVLYHVTVPVRRATKDVTGAHDIVEEVARRFGFDAIEPVMPSLPARASDIRPVLLMRQLKDFLAYSAHMREQRNYAFYDENVLAALQWEGHGVSPDMYERHLDSPSALKNPVSKASYRLIANLLPHLFANVQQNIADNEKCSFFEWGTVWPSGPENEQYQMAGVWYDKRGGLDFYTLKAHVVGLCARANVAVTFEAATDDSMQPWMAASQRAAVMHNGVVVGYFGKVDPVMVQRMGALPESTAYAFVVNGSYLMQQQAPQFDVGALRKHQHSTFDVSVMVPLKATVVSLEHAISALDDLIINVRLIDFFEKKEWTDRRSIALRVTLACADRTVSREETEQVRQQVIEVLEQHGGQLRA